MTDKGKSVISLAARKAMPVGSFLLVLSWVAVGFAPGLCSIVGSEEYVASIGSLWRLTPFYPGQNRLGSFIPLLAAVVRDPDWNLHAQLILHTLFGFSSIYLGISYFFRKNLVILTFLLIIASLFYQADLAFIYVVWVGSFPYSTSITLFFLAAFLLRPDLSRKESARWTAPRIIGSFLLLLLAFWVDLSLAPFIFFYALATTTIAAYRRGHLRGSYNTKTEQPRIGLLISFWSHISQQYGVILAAFSGTAFTIAYLFSRLYDYFWPELTRSFSRSDYTRLNFSWESLMISSKNIIQASGGTIFVVQVGAVFTFFVIHIYVTQTRQNRLSEFQLERETWVRYLALLMSAVGYILLISQLEHVRQNSYNFRYFIPALLVLIGLFYYYIALILQRLARSADKQLKSQRFSQLLLLPAGLLLASSSIYHRIGENPTGCTFMHHSLANERARYAVSEGYAGILGSYWDSWPVVHRALELSQEKGPSDHIFPTGYRAEVFAADALRRFEQDLSGQSHSYRLLCLEPGKEKTEFGTIDCRQLFHWNKVWGTLPMAGTIREIEMLPELRSESMVIGLVTVGIGDRLEFIRNGNGEGVLSNGWSPAEDFGSWTEGHRSEMRLVIEQPVTDDVEIAFEIVTGVGAFVRNPPSMSVEVLVNDTKVAVWDFPTGGESGERRIKLPAPVRAQADTTTITFVAHDPHSPRDLGFEPNDNRQLGIAVRRLTLLPADD